MDEIKTKQQVVEAIKQAEKILITVSDDPSVDALSAALGLALILDKQGKYVTAIYSGQTPPAIAFLQPEKTFDDTTDSLRDFIIALNKDKADHLRYKVEGDAVKIFITPYKTTITDKDLEFSQGDYNVELVIALGVDKQEHLDGALENHGQILHDADIITLTASDQMSDLGGIDWHDSHVSSLSEMVAGLAEALKDDKKKSLLDSASATALLTGIVAQTDRFSNEHTTSKVMTVAASLMAAGADQQLVATELQRASERAQAPDASNEPDSSLDDAESDSAETPGANEGEGNGDGSGQDAWDNSAQDDVVVDTSSADGEMTIKKEKDGLTIKHDAETLADLDRRVRGEEKAKEKVEEEIEELEEEAKSQAKEYPLVDDTPTIPRQSVDTPPAASGELHSAYALEQDAVEPLLGGTLNATAEQAAEDARKAAEDDQNRTILSHAYIGDQSGQPAQEAQSAQPAEPADAGPLAQQPIASVATVSLDETPGGFPGTPPAAPGSVGVNEVSADEGPVHSAYAIDDAPVPGAASFEGKTIEPPTSSSLAVGGERVVQPPVAGVDLQPVSPQSLDTQPLDAQPLANPSPADLGLPLPPPLPDFSAFAGAPGPALPLPPTQPPAILGDILAPEPLQPIQPAQPASALETPPGFSTPQSDPGQFKIPGQP